MNHATSLPQLAVLAPLEIDFAPVPQAIPQTAQDIFQVLEMEVIELKAKVAQAEKRNNELKHVLHSIYTTPAQKRALLEELEWKHKISRRRACRLLNLARSTCWYRTAAEGRLPPKPSKPITALSQTSMIAHLKKVSRQIKNGFIAGEECVQEQFACGLIRLGLPVAANLAKMNLNLAIDIFLAWCERTGK